MKAKISIFMSIVLLISMLSSCDSGNAKAGKSDDKSTQIAYVTNSGAGSNQSTQIVYVTDSGEKYHREDCRYLSKSKISISLSKAKQQGYEPCSVCNPPK